MQHVLCLDLADDPALIDRYEKHHRSVWPGVLAHLRRHGISDMTIHRFGTRLVMVMTTDDAVFDAERFDKATATDPVVQHWETLMWEFQRPTPWTPAGRKWMPMTCIFDLGAA